MGLIGCNGILKTRADIEVKPARTGGESWSLCERLSARINEGF